MKLGRLKSTVDRERRSVHQADRTVVSLDERAVLMFRELNW